jgi:predicted ester cyclase
LRETVHGPEAFKQVIMRIHAGLSDVEAVSEEVIAEGDQVVVRWTLRGIHAGEIQGIPPTGKHLTLTGIGFYRLTEGKIVEERGEADALGYMQQLGVIPAMR